MVRDLMNENYYKDQFSMVNILASDIQFFQQPAN